MFGDFTHILKGTFYKVLLEKGGLNYMSSLCICDQFCKIDHIAPPTQYVPFLLLFSLSTLLHFPKFYFSGNFVQ